MTQVLLLGGLITIAAGELCDRFQTRRLFLPGIKEAEALLKAPLPVMRQVSRDIHTSLTALLTRT